MATDPIIRDMNAAIHNARTNIRQAEKIISATEGKPMSDARRDAKRSKNLHQYYLRRLERYRNELTERLRNENQRKSVAVQSLKECLKNTANL